MLTKQELIQEGLLYLSAGRSVAPVKGKFPWMSPEYNNEVSWETYQHEYIAPEILVRLCNDRRTTGLCMICGKISGGVEIIDFDFKLGQCWYQRWRELVGAHADGLPVVRTGGGGYQLGYRCPSPDGNQKLAHLQTNNPDEPWKALIETRGEGGLVVIPPSPHPETGKNYQFLTGHFSDLPLISQEVRDILIDAARLLCQKPKASAKPRRRREVSGFSRIQGESVIQAFNRMEDIGYWLEQRNYTVVNDSWAIRPGGERKTVKIRDNRSYHNAASDPLNDGFWKTPFELMLGHPQYGNDDFRAALEHASVITGIPIMTWKLARSYERSEVAAPVLTPAPQPDYSLVIVTDDADGASALQALGVPTVVGDRFGHNLADVRQMIEQYQRKVVILKPEQDGAAEVLAADLGAELVDLPVRLTDFFADGSHTLIDFVAAVRAALAPVYRLGHKLGRKW